MKRRPAIYPPTAAKAEPSIEPRATAIQRAIALDQRARASLALALIDAARWDGHRFTIAHPESLLGMVTVPPEFTRDLHLGRIRAAIQERLDEWQRRAEELDAA